MQLGGNKSTCLDRTWSPTAVSILYEEMCTFKILFDLNEELENLNKTKIILFAHLTVQAIKSNCK